jgi:hypothetical protein
MLKSEAITGRIMTEITEKVKDIMSEAIAHYREIDFQQIEETVTELKERFSKLLTDGVLEAIGNGRQGTTIDCDCGGVYNYVSERRWLLTSLNGRIEIYRAYYYCDKCKSSKFPLDEQLCLEGKHQSIGVRKQMALEGMREPFCEASKLLEEESDITVSSKEIQLESEEIGREVSMQVEREVEALWSEKKEIKPESFPERLYISADGTGVRTQGGNKEVKIGSVYETPPTHGAIANDIQYTGGFAEAEEFGKRLYVLAAKRGYEKAKESVFLGDGAKWIWNIAKYHFPNAVQILDWYHAEERIWDVGKAVYGEGTKATSEWVKEQLGYLSRGDAESVIISLMYLISPKPATKAPEALKKINDNITYFESNQGRMRYDEYKAKGYHIGSGTAESACKHVVGQRLKQAGMTWSIKGAEAILQLRILWKNNEWNRFWQNRKKTVKVAA